MMNRLLRHYGTLFFLFVLLAVFSVRSEYFFSFENLFNILLQQSIPIMMASGMTLVIVLGTFDLSTGAVAGLSGTVTYLLIPRAGVGPAFLAGLSCGLLFGLMNGVLVSRLGLSGIITTLATMFAGIGIELALTGGNRGPVDPSAVTFLKLGHGTLGGIPVPVLLMFGFVAFLFVLSEKSPLGRKLYAIGDNAIAAHFSGVRVDRSALLAFLISSGVSGFAGIVLLARLSSYQMYQGQPLLLDAVAAVFVGATLKREGVPHIIGTVFGALFLGVLVNGAVMVGMPYVYTNIFKGVILLAAVALTTLLKKEEMRARFV